MNKINTAIELQTNHDTDRIALRGVRLTATVSALSLKASLEQTFVNQEPRAIEAIYTFPLPETAAVCGFEVRTGDHVLTGKVEEADHALKQYDEAIVDGHGAYLLEQDRPDVFTTRVGNLKPSQAATIAVSYVAPIERVDRSIRVRIPTTIAPRYVSAAGTNDPLQTAVDGDALNPPHVLHVPYGVTIQVKIQLGSEVRKITSPTHAIQVEAPTVEGMPWTMRFAGDLTQMDRDIVLEIEMLREAQPCIQVATGPDEAKYLAITFVPEFDERQQDESSAGETVFLLDCSGSMQGESISQATTALALCLRSLSPGDTFNVCRFGSTFELLSPTPVLYSAATLEQSLRFIARGADLGGTEIYEPLKNVMELAPQRGSVRNVVVLTDGQVTNEPAVIALARKWRGTNRLFTFGIGASASGYLVRSLARVSRGAAEFISGNERIEDKVLRTFSRIGSPLVRDITVRWGGGELQTPGETPSLFDGDVLQVFARAPGRLPEMVTLECVTPAGPQRWSLPVPTETIPDDGVIATAWAQAMIQHLEDGEEQPTTVRKRNSSTARRLVTLSKQFNILCSQTAFIAVEHRTLAERNEGMPELRRVPVKLANGWGGSVAMQSAAYAPPPPPSKGARFRKSSGLDSMMSQFAGYVASALPCAAMPDATMDAMELSEPAASGEQDELLELLALQSADGWFADDYVKLFAASSRDLSSIHSQIESICGPSLSSQDPLRAKLMSTITVIVALRIWFAERREVWRRAEAKARRWVVQTKALNEEALQRVVESVQVG